MNKRGSILIMGFMVVTVVAVLTSSFLFKHVSTSFQNKRYIDSIHALWAAEAGISEAISQLPDLTVSGSVGSSGNTYSAATSQIGGSSYYQIVSTGTAEDISRTLQVVINTRDVDPTKFKYGIETTVELVVKGSVDINPAGSEKEYSSINFADLFTFSKEEIKSFSNVWTSVPATDFSGLNWLELPSGGTITGNLVGSGILIVEGDIHIAGTVIFDGIIYVIGKLTMSGTPIVSGTILSESDTELIEDTTVTGNVTINYDQSKIAAAMALLSYISPEVVSWKEITQ